MVFMKRGFTLLEFLLVAAVIAFLSYLGAVSVSAQRKKANDAKRRSDIHELQVAIEAYYSDRLTGVVGGGVQYPTALPAPGASFISADGQTVYLNRVPADPVNRDPYLYTYWATPAAAPAAYIVCAYRLEAVAGSVCLTNRQ